MGHPAWPAPALGSEALLVTVTGPGADQPHLPFCQVMAGRGAPEVSQASTTDMPSITVLSRGPLVMLGAMPASGDRGASQLHPGGVPGQALQPLPLRLVWAPLWGRKQVP